MPGDGDDQRGGQSTGGRLLTNRGKRTRATLVEAAKRVFEQIPFSQARVTDITAEASVSTGTFYTYFDSKEDVFREVAAMVLDEMSRAPREAPSGDGDRTAGIANASRAYFLAVLRNATVARSIEQLTLADPEVAAARRGTVVGGVKRVERWIRQLQDEGICDHRIDAWTTAMVLHTMNVRVAYDHLVLSADVDDVERLVETVTHIWARTVGLETVDP